MTRGLPLPAALAVFAIGWGAGWATDVPALAGRATRAQAVVDEPLPAPWRFPNGHLAIWYMAPEPHTEGHWSACYRIMRNPPP